MARKKDDDEKAPSVLVNDITGAISRLNDRAYSLRNQIDAATEKHVQPLKDELKALYRDTKAGTNVPIKALKAHYKLYEMALDAANDEDGGDETLDGMRLAFEALQKNETLDWLNAVEVTHAPGKAPDFVGAGMDQETETQGSA
jgi:5'-deoxynucleotidase YfbR-like HD superfamily hydrolase